MAAGTGYRGALRATQWINVGNAYKCAKYTQMDHTAWMEAAQLSQKALWWNPRKKVAAVICSKAPTIDPAFRPQFTNMEKVVVPQASGSHHGYDLCRDFIEDEFAVQQVLQRIDIGHPVAVAPWIHGADVLNVERLLRERGVTVISQVETLVGSVADFEQKATFHRMMEEAGLAHLRPRTHIMENGSMTMSADQFRNIAGGSYYLKGNQGAGGSTVMKLQIPEVFDHNIVRDQLESPEAMGTPIKVLKSPMDWQAPYLLEQDTAELGLPCSASVDFQVGDSGLIAEPIIADMYIRNDRNYAGFIRRPKDALMREPWYSTVLDATDKIAKELSARGYCGSFANIDVQYRSDRSDVKVLELNPRRSAILDGHDALASQYPNHDGLYAFGVDYCTLTNRDIEEIRNVTSASLEVLQLTGTPEMFYRSMMFTSPCGGDIGVVRSWL
uniref:ATP-grasp domain-containing protein n=1 Tax=Alexandrium catenella TaxID=2925 RepID=A0A7S1SE97_ALECA